MRLDADHRVDLDVIPHDDLVVAIFGREVPVEALQTKASRVCREIRFDCAKRQAAFCDEALDDRHDLLGLDYVGDAVIAGRARNKAVRFRFAQVGHESSCADGRIDLEGRSKQRVANRQAWTTSLLLRFGDFAAQVAEQAAEGFLFAGLRSVVGWPVRGRRHDPSAVALLHDLGRGRDCESPLLSCVHYRRDFFRGVRSEPLKLDS